jgi:PAS domain-containing protein
MINYSEIDLIQQCAVAAFVIDTSHRVVYWNSACEQLTGVEAGAVIGTDLHGQVFYEPARYCLSDFMIDGTLGQLAEQYGVYGKSTLFSGGWHAEGWYPDLGDRRRYITFDTALIHSQEGNLIGAIETLQDITERKQVEEEYRDLTVKLRVLLDRSKALKGLLPICASCKKVRGDDGNWSKLESYVTESFGVQFSHGICADCAQEKYPEFIESIEKGDRHGQI